MSDPEVAFSPDTPPVVQNFCFPPLIYTNDTLYKYFRDTESESLDDGFVYIGKIESQVPQTQSPEENFQANTDIVGAKIYQSSNYLIVVIGERYVYYYLLTDYDNHFLSEDADNWKEGQYEKEYSECFISN